MIIESVGPPKRKVEDYDFWFTNGQIMSLQIDKEAGDTVDFTTHPTVVMIHLASKPHKTDPETMMPAEDITLFMSHIISIIKKSREVQPMSVEQQQEWRKTVQEIVKTTKVM
jgi:hypothetical protein